MSRIKGCFENLRSVGRTALIPYVTAGDPEPATTVPLMHAMRDAGADIIELGVPFSDPMADGPVIQRATERALEHNVSLNDVLGMVVEFRQTDDATPVVLMGYLNPFEVMGYETLASRAAEAGVDGILTVDLPPEEAADFIASLKAHEIDPIFLLAPTSTAERIDAVVDHAGGFVYYVSVKGVTGASSLDVSSVKQKLAEIRGHTELPVGVGFGIKDAESAAAIGAFSDAVVVGSAIVSRIEALNGDNKKIQSGISAILSDMRQALDAK